MLTQSSLLTDLFILNPLYIYGFADSRAHETAAGAPARRRAAARTRAAPRARKVFATRASHRGFAREHVGDGVRISEVHAGVTSG